MDWVVYTRLLLNKLSVEGINKYITPNLFDLTDLGTVSGQYDENDMFVYPNLVRLTKDSIKNVDWCLLDDGINLYLYLLKSAN